MRRPLPAFAKDLADARSRGYTLRNPAVGVSLDWWRPSIGYGVAVPDDADPASLEWGWVRGLEVLVWRRGEPVERVRAAVHAIKAARPHRLIVIDVSDPDEHGGRIYSIVRPS